MVKRSSSEPGEFRELHDLRELVAALIAAHDARRNAEKAIDRVVVQMRGRVSGGGRG